MTHLFSDFESQAYADEADAWNENYYRYLTEVEGVNADEAWHIVYAN